MDWLDRSWRLYVDLPVRPACLKRDRPSHHPRTASRPNPRAYLAFMHSTGRRVCSALGCVIAIAVEVLQTGSFDS
jgi:hypothetical protein